MDTFAKLARDLAVLATVAFTAFWCGQSAIGKPADAAGVSENADMIAVTGEFGSGTSVLYLVDTRGKTLLVYEARGGTQQDLKLVAARDISYDLRLRSYNDKSDSGLSVDDLERRWRKFVSPRGDAAVGRNQSSRRRPAKAEKPEAVVPAGSPEKKTPENKTPVKMDGEESKRPSPEVGTVGPKKEPAPGR